MSPERHFTDQEIHEASGQAPRSPAGIPHATCLLCGSDYEAWYASQACDCRIVLADLATYKEWLIRFQRWGFGVLKSPSGAKFPYDKEISGRTMLTQFLQSNIHIGPEYVLKDNYYSAFEGFAEAP